MEDMLPGKPVKGESEQIIRIITSSMLDAQKLFPSQCPNRKVKNDKEGNKKNGRYWLLRLCAGAPHPGPRGPGIVSAPVPKKLLLTAGIDDSCTSARGCTAILGNFAKATFDAISKTYNYLTANLWEYMVFTRSPIRNLLTIWVDISNSDSDTYAMKT
eukprot:bmy_07064T0